MESSTGSSEDSSLSGLSNIKLIISTFTSRDGFFGSKLNVPGENNSTEEFRSLVDDGNKIPPPSSLVVLFDMFI